MMNLKKDIKKLPAAAAFMLQKEIECGDVYRLAKNNVVRGTLESGAEYREPLVIV